MNDPFKEIAQIVAGAQTRSEELSWYHAMVLLLDTGMVGEEFGKQILRDTKAVNHMDARGTSDLRYTRDAIADYIEGLVASQKKVIEETTNRMHLLAKIASTVRG